MAQKRMISLRVVDTDHFIDMPSTARLLYYDLNIRADDDGFVGNPKKIIKMSGASDDDYRILCAKLYVIPFQSGVCVIRHWLIHNLIRHDRYSETEYLHEKSTLLVENKKYDVIPDGNQMSYQMAPQIRLGKVRLGKDSILPDEHEIFEHWNDQKTLISHKTIEKHLTKIQAALKNYSVEEIKGAISQYARITDQPASLYSYKWILKDFLQRGLDRFTAGLPDENFISKSIDYKAAEKQRQEKEREEKYRRLGLDDK